MILLVIIYKYTLPIIIIIFIVKCCMFQFYIQNINVLLRYDVDDDGDNNIYVWEQ